MSTNSNKRENNAIRKPRTDAFTFTVHWVLVAALILSLLTGLRIAADYHQSAVGVLARALPGVLAEGAVIEWHVWASWTLFFLAIAYAIFLWRSKQGVRVRIDRSATASPSAHCPQSHLSFSNKP